MDAANMAPKIAVEPAGSSDHLAAAVRAGGGEVVALADAEALVWTDARGSLALGAALSARPDLAWVQLPFAGIEPLVGQLDHERIWTCGKGVYAEPVAEHALGLALAGMRHLAGYARQKTWTAPAGVNLLGARVVIVGGGEITRSLLRLLGPFNCNITVVRRSAQDIPGVSRVVTSDALIEVVADADLVVLTLALTPQTVGIIDASVLAAMPQHAWLVNVARGGHIVTDDLVAACSQGSIGGAALDVTDPEPLPAAHPLWSLPNVIITPHIANTPEMGRPLLAARVTENVRRWAAREPLEGLVDVDLGY